MNTINIMRELEIGIGIDTLCTVEYRMVKEQEEQFVGGTMNLISSIYPEIIDIVIKDEYSGYELGQHRLNGEPLRVLSEDKSVFSHFQAMGMIDKILTCIEEICE
jgi:hypothetical protein